MSRLEVAVEPLLRRLWAPTYPLGATTLSPAESAIVAVWAAKTVWMRELLDVGPRTPTPAMRTYLMGHQLPPEFTRMWVARYAGESNFGATLAHVQVSHQDDAWNSEDHRMILMGLLTVNGLAMLTRTDSGWGVPEFALPDRIWRQAWPCSDFVQWPPPQVATDLDLREAISRYSWLRMPDDAEFRQYPTGVKYVRRN